LHNTNIYVNVNDISETKFSCKFVYIFMVALCQGEHKAMVGWWKLRELLEEQSLVRTQPSAAS